MALPIRNISKLHKSLEYNFLYNNDISSINLLLAMLENEIRLKKLRPKYYCMKSIRRVLRRGLYYRSDSELVIHTINKLINDDIARLELSMYIDSYTLGFRDDDWVNRLEMLALDILPCEALSQSTLLFHESENPTVLELKDKIVNQLDQDSFNIDRIKRMTYSYLEKVIKRKIYSINDHLDKQLMIKLYDEDKYVIGSDFLTIPELTTIYQKIVSITMKSMVKIFKSSYWYGINDRVLNRY